MAKICWLSNVGAAARYIRLAEFCRENGLKKEADEFGPKAVSVK